MKKKLNCLFPVGILCFILIACTAVICSGKTVYAEDDMPFDGFYEYDMQTGKELEYNISVPDKDDDDLVLEGYEGSTLPEKVNAVSVKQYAASASKSVVSQKASAKSKKTGWINKGKYTYYRTKKGVLIKDQIKDIGKNTYLFDKKGRVVKGTVKTGIYTSYYSKSDGHYLYSCIDLKIKKIWKGVAVGKNSKSEYNIPGSVKVTNSKGKTVSFSRLKKGQKIRVYYQGDLLESFPAQFEKVLKVKIL